MSPIATIVISIACVALYYLIFCQERFRDLERYKADYAHINDNEDRLRTHNTQLISECETLRSENKSLNVKVIRIEYLEELIKRNYDESYELRMELNNAKSELNAAREEYSLLSEQHTSLLREYEYYKSFHE
jgi:septal ring factor EnvC (AmiA/AmiB activator)